MTFDPDGPLPSVQENVAFPGMITYPQGQFAVVKLFERDSPSIEVILPLTPTTFPENGTAAERNYDVIGAGSHTAPSGRAPREFTLDGTFLGGPRAPLSAVHDWRPPQDLAEQIRRWVDRATLLHLQVYGRAGPIDIACYVSKYTFTRKGWAGDVTFNVTCKEWRPLRVLIDDGSDSTTAISGGAGSDTDVGGASDTGSPEAPPEEPLPATYTVVPDDTLELIAKRMLGDTGRWPEIYDANSDVIGDDPQTLEPGIQLSIPGGHVDADEDYA
jgi:hypothetical protein